MVIASWHGNDVAQCSKIQKQVQIWWLLPIAFRGKRKAMFIEHYCELYVFGATIFSIYTSEFIPIPQFWNLGGVKFHINERYIAIYWHMICIL